MQCRRKWAFSFVMIILRAPSRQPCISLRHLGRRPTFLDGITFGSHSVFTTHSLLSWWGPADCQAPLYWAAASFKQLTFPDVKHAPAILPAASISDAGHIFITPGIRVDAIVRCPGLLRCVFDVGAVCKYARLRKPSLCMLQQSACGRCNLLCAHPCFRYQC